jgi:hypothetical protein
MNDAQLPPMRKYPAALTSFRKAVELDPQHAEAKSNIKMIEDITRRWASDTAIASTALGKAGLWISVGAHGLPPVSSSMRWTAPPGGSVCPGLSWRRLWTRLLR